MKKKKVLLRWVIVLSALYTLGHILFGFDETQSIRAITSLIGAALFVSILLYLNLKEQETTGQKDTPLTLGMSKSLFKLVSIFILLGIAKHLYFLLHGAITYFTWESFGADFLALFISVVCFFMFLKIK
ncbi:hypothetical protein L2D08_20290 [Domibacillus sp. PGB-M46]|uniref:hypothetical protein n=1 Tax=Domibacillus sp. PGB-M46 TaxID=2910255 RepID=UPI001F57FF86|nr:hypothetical protein [Domibacillus sp. PGB-M46]MCI2256675.1 hypothetical protein [Domibacillus sp. PGB-M46]